MNNVAKSPGKLNSNHEHPLSFSKPPEGSSISGFSVKVAQRTSKGCLPERMTEARVSLEFSSVSPGHFLVKLQRRLALCACLLRCVPSVLKKKMANANTSTEVFNYREFSIQITWSSSVSVLCCDSGGGDAVIQEGACLPECVMLDSALAGAAVSSS